MKKPDVISATDFIPRDRLYFQFSISNLRSIGCKTILLSISCLFTLNRLYFSFTAYTL